MSWSQLGRDARSLLSQIGAVGHHFDSLTVAMVAEILSPMETGRCYEHYKSRFFVFVFVFFFTSTQLDLVVQKILFMRDLKVRDC